MKTLLRAVLFLFSMSICGAALADASPQAVSANGIKTIGNPEAPQGGTFVATLKAEPESLNPISSSDYYSFVVQSFVLDGLMTYNIETNEREPGLAERYEVSKDELTYTFYLRKDAKFHDGKPVTAEDVKFSFDSVKDPAFKAGHRMPYYEDIKSVDVIDPYTVKVSLKKKYFKNFDVVASGGFTPILPKHVYGDPKKKLNKVMVGSGPYKLASYDRGKSLTLERNPGWWGNSVSHLKGKHNYSKILFRFVKEENLRLEMLKKGQIDFLELTPEAFFQKTEGEPFGKTVLKKKVQNSSNKGYLFVAWNFKQPLFKDKNVRIALAHLMNREEMNKKFNYGADVLATGPWEVANPYANQEVKPLGFNLSQAKELLKKAGWQDANKDGVLEKTIDGKPVEFRFTLLFANRDREKYYTMYKEDLKKAGIDMELKMVEWNSFIKALDDKKFDAVSLGWSGGSIEGDPKQIWHSEAAREGGSNFIGYSNPEVDKLIDAARVELDVKKRAGMWKKIHKLIADDAPYAFMFNSVFEFYSINGKIGQVKDTFKYDVGLDYSWMKIVK